METPCPLVLGTPTNPCLLELDKKIFWYFWVRIGEVSWNVLPIFSSTCSVIQRPTSHTPLPLPAAVAGPATTHHPPPSPRPSRPHPPWPPRPPLLSLPALGRPLPSPSHPWPPSRPILPPPSPPSPILPWQRYHWPAASLAGNGRPAVRSRAVEWRDETKKTEAKQRR